MISTFLWAFAILLVSMVTILLIFITKTQDTNLLRIYQMDSEYLSSILTLLKKTFAFYEIIDGKLIGLIVFLVSNILTGLINLSIGTKFVSILTSLVILVMHAFLSVGSGYLVYFYFKFFKNYYKRSTFKDIL